MRVNAVLESAPVVTPAQRYDVGCAYCWDGECPTAGRVRRKNVCARCLAAMREAGGSAPPLVRTATLPPERVRSLVRYLLRLDGQRDYARPLYERALRERGSWKPT